MFQRLRGAIDRTIAEEQARQKSADSASPSRSGSTSSRRSDANAAAAGRRARAKKSSTDITDNDGAPNPDPAVFVIDDGDDPSRPSTPSPPAPPEKDTPDGCGSGTPATAAAAGTDAQAGTTTPDGAVAEKKPAVDGAATTTSNANSPDASTTAPADLSPEIKQRLRKLEKLEATYPELLRSYRIAHKRATAIEPFEKALRENTPLASIGDPEALVEYLNQLNLRGDMVMDELKRVSGDRDELKKKHEQSEEKLRQALEELESLKSSTPAAEQRKSVDSQARSTSVAEATGSEKAKDSPDPAAGGDFFSYDEEVPLLQAEVASKTEEVQQLRGRVEDLQKELSVAKENSTVLAENLERATRELSESRESEGSSAQSQLKTLREQADRDRQAYASKLGDAESSLAKSDERCAELDAELAKANGAIKVCKKLIDDLGAQIDSLKKEKADGLAKIDELTTRLESAAAEGPSPATSTATGGSTSKKKNNKKKKGKGGAAAAAAAAAATPAAVTSAAPAEKEKGSAENNAPDHGAGVDKASSSTAALESEIAKLKTEVEARDEEIERLSRKRKSEQLLREEIEHLQENLLAIGQDHVEAKEKVKELEQEIKSRCDADLGSRLQSELDVLRREHDELRQKSAALQSDLGAAQQLAQTRFKDLTELREVLQKAQPELKSLREESAQLKKTREELGAKVRELRAMEKREADLKRELGKAQQLASDGDKEAKALQEKLKSECAARQRAEDGKRAGDKELRRAEADKIEWSARAEKTERELQGARDELDRLRPRVRELEEQMHALRRDKTASQEEAEFKAQQYANAQGLLASMRDQATELSVQLHEAQSQAESLEEELSEVQRLLQERTREGETMRRLLADVDERADAQVREMRARMEAAIEERERIED
ncbi:hypothetical protein E4U41_007638, partial [Claviceps citrina]